MLITVLLLPGIFGNLVVSGVAAAAATPETTAKPIDPYLGLHTFRCDR
jgi:hypothetical protein